ncbi:MAG: hypothetical protein NHF89_00090 [Candidatus Shikimatogenerans bostrichidophilus]|nr:MAG: hypothetical protein NHF89_00090 [Candidatus Shikimatogenerans bostrichidophilus]
MNIIIIKLLNKNINKKIINVFNYLGIKPIITNNKNKILNSDKVIIYSTFDIKKTIKLIKKKKLNKIIYKLKQPVLAISMGLYMLCYKYKKIKFLNIFKNIKIKKILDFNKESKNNIGWSKVYHNNDEKLFYGLKKNYFYQYFIHNYYITVGKYCISHTNHIISYSAVLKKNNFYGLQFNPEISGENGRKILINFLYLI